MVQCPVCNEVCEVPNNEIDVLPVDNARQHLVKFFKVSIQCVLIMFCQQSTKPSLVIFLTKSNRPDFNIGIKHDFPFINIRKVPREVLKTEGEARGFQHLPRDLANVNE